MSKENKIKVRRKRRKKNNFLRSKERNEIETIVRSGSFEKRIGAKKFLRRIKRRGIRRDLGRFSSN